MTIESLRRRLDQLDNSGDRKIYRVEADERDMYRLPEGPEVQAEIAAIRAADPRAHVILSVTVDGEISHEESAERVAALMAARMAEEVP